jgi:hypothetical protein
MADRGWRNAKLGRGFLEAQVPRRGVKGTQLDEGWQLVHRPSVDENGSPWAEFFAFALRIPEVEETGPIEENAHEVSSIRRRRRRRVFQQVLGATP